MVDSSSEILVVVGPEGGLSQAEIEMLGSWGAKPICVSPHTLRIETAAIALASVLVAAQMNESE